MPHGHRLGLTQRNVPEVAGTLAAFSSTAIPDIAGCQRHSKIQKGFVTKTFGQTAYSQGNLTDGRIRDVRPVGARGTE